MSSCYLNHLISVKFCLRVFPEECPLITILGNLLILQITNVELKKLSQNEPNYKTHIQIKKQNTNSTSGPLLSLLLFTAPRPLPGVNTNLTSSADGFCLS